MTIPNATTRYIREAVRNNPALYDRYLNNAHFHVTVDRACQESTAQGAVRVLLDGLGVSADANTTLLNELTLLAELGVTR